MNTTILINQNFIYAILLFLVLSRITRPYYPFVGAIEERENDFYITKNYYFLFIKFYQESIKDKNPNI